MIAWPPCGPCGCPAFWGDGATYYAMAWSLAEDLDLRYEARDVFRVRREFPWGRRASS